ncbi:SxtJ family membrane protein [Pelagibacteraceae bacterium]|nr:SxtJ family membrane protein [Pelagibacteraceae bacterium]
MKKNLAEKNFGLLFGLIFLIIALWPVLSGLKLQLWYFIIAIIFFIIAFLKPIIFKPFNKAWIKFGEILGLIIAPIVMALVYFIILTPISLMVRIFGKDLLGLKFSKKQDTYWIKREKKPGTMKKQF